MQLWLAWNLQIRAPPAFASQVPAGIKGMSH